MSRQSVENIDPAYEPTNGYDTYNPLAYSPAYDKAENRADNLRSQALAALRSAETVGAQATIRTSITFKVNFES